MTSEITILLSIYPPNIWFVEDVSHAGAPDMRFVEDFSHAGAHNIRFVEIVSRAGAKPA